MVRIVSEQTRQRMSRAQLSLRQQKFIREYVANNGNGTAAARAAGYSASSNDVLRQQASENLAKPHIISALKQELAKVDANVTPQRVKNRLCEISHAAQEAGQFGPAVRAEELLGKSIGLFIDRTLQLSGMLNDSHIAALLEIARRRQAEPVDLTDDEPDR
jgi:hypothetical protein